MIAVFVNPIDALRAAAETVGVAVEWYPADTITSESRVILSAVEVAQLETIYQGRRDWNSIKGDLDI